MRRVLQKVQKCAVGGMAAASPPLTAIWWGPLMARLEGPNGALLRERYLLLLNSHWLRVTMVSVYALLMLGMLGQSAGRGMF